MATITLRYDLRVPPFAPGTHADAYRACLDQCAWGDERGVDVVTLSEHHGVEDGFLSAPVTLAAAIAGRTSRMMINIAALLLPLHEPIRLAEQLAVVDLVSGGRFTFVAGLGYRQEEFDMAGVERRGRGRVMEEYVEVLRRAWSGEPFEWRGRTVRVTPKPSHGPMFLLGGSTERAARRAARLRAGFFPSIGDPALQAAYEDECATVGFDAGFVSLPNGPGFVHVSDDPERDWARIAPYAVFDAQTYASWQPAGQRSSVHTTATTPEAVRATGIYRVVTPDECVALAAESSSIVLHPLMGGMPPELGWESLERFAAKVLPRIRPT